MRFWLRTANLFLLLGFGILSAQTKFLVDAWYEYLNVSDDPSYYKSQVLTRLYNKNNWKQDNYGSEQPLSHGVTWLKFRTKTDVAPGIILWANLVGEHRGASYGDRSSDNIFVYPSGFFRLEKQLFSDFDFRLKMGDFDDYRLNQGLYLFNQDVRGIEAEFELSEAISYKYFWVADLVRSVGLRTDDLFVHTLALNFGDSTSEYSSHSSVSMGKCLGDMDTVKSKLVWTLGSEFYWAKSWSGYFSAGNRGFDNRSGAYLLGGKFAQNRSKSELNFRLEGRYYEENFLSGLKNDVDYIDLEKTQGANTIGNELYPLSAYKNPFSQLAVFSEYQGVYTEGQKEKILKTDVWGVSLQGEYLRRFEPFFASVDFDLNYVKPDEFAGILYPFCIFKIGYEPAKNNKIAFVVSNKGINLNKSYKTFYAYKDFFWGLSFSRDLNFN